LWVFPQNSRYFVTGSTLEAKFIRKTPETPSDMLYGEKRESGNYKISAKTYIIVASTSRIIDMTQRFLNAEQEG
jgi:hypothetical protein